MRRGLRVQRYSDLPCLARLQLDLRPAHQSPGRLAGAGGQAKVDLCNLGTRTCTSIREREVHLYGPCAVSRLGFHMEPVIGKARVGESIPEREERLNPELVVAPVADSESLTEVSDEVVSASILLWRRDRGALIATREGNRQLARRSDVAKQDVSKSIALLLAAIPALQHRRNPVEPGK